MNDIISPGCQYPHLTVISALTWPRGSNLNPRPSISAEVKVSGTSIRAMSSSTSEQDQTDTSSPSSVSVAEYLPNDYDVAVIGYGCRVPGGINNPSELWEFLLEKGDASGNIPQMRWEPYNNRQAVNAEILAQITSKGYFLDKLEDFDASFFGISPREAEQIDPQQRIAVEVAWEALENSGIPPQSLARSDTAVYMGVNSDDYSRLLLEDLPNVEAWMGVGTAFCGIPNRISYLLDLMGPSEAVDAACASSLVAIHTARRALIARETSLAIAGGVNALIGPGLTRVLDKAGALSSDGICRSFDNAAAGYGRGEGAGIVILKRLSDAFRDGDRILAVLKGSAVGADGRTNGIMAPNREAQERVARKALKEARLSAHEISYVEGHATSTSIGDPTECAAIANVYGVGSGRPESEPCYIGSVKSNIGHLEAGAGVMGLIKAILVLQNQMIPPQANLITLNNKIDWEKSCLKVNTKSIPLLADGQPRKAAVASYGYGGTVSHAIVEAAPSVPPPLHRVRPPGRVEDLTVLLLSAPQPSRIKSAAARLAYWLKDSWNTRNHDYGIESIAYTLAAKRGHHKFRTAIVTGSRTEAVELLQKLAQSQQSDQIYSDHVLGKSENEGTVWVFSGHGAQWKEMGQNLVHEEPAFAQIVEQLEPVIQQRMGFSITDTLTRGEFDTVDCIQISTYVMQIGLAEVLRSRGVRPKAVIGHSLGELAASVVAGALTPVEGAVICCIRSRLYLKVAGAGAMILVSIPFRVAICELGSRSDIVAAIDSSPSSCVVAGMVDAIEEFSAKWKQAGHTVRIVKSNVAFHSPSVLQLATPLRGALKGLLSPQNPSIPLYSTSTLDPRSKCLRDAEYWVNNMTKPVLFTSAVTAAANDNHKVFVEVSSHPIVTFSIKETLIDAKRPDGIVLPTLLRNKSNQKSILLALGKLHCIGDLIDFKSFLRGNWLDEVPGTVWEHQQYWRKVSSPTDRKIVTHNVTSHQLLGRRTQISGSRNFIWETQLDPSVKPFPGNHPLYGVEIVPAAVLLNTFLSAAPGHSLRNVSLRVPLVVGPPHNVQVLLENNRLKIFSSLIEKESGESDSHSWLMNTKCEITLGRALSPALRIDLGALEQSIPRKLDASFTVNYLAKAGVSEMGFPWRVIEHLENDSEMLAKVHAGPDASSSKHWDGTSWASVLDAATSISSTVFYKEPLLRMPSAISGVTALPETRTPKICYIYTKIVSDKNHVADILILDEEGNILICIDGLRFAGIEGDPAARGSDKDLVYRIAWPPAQLTEHPLRFDNVLFISNEFPLLQSYRAALSSVGIESGNVAGPEDIVSIQDNSIVVFLPDIAKTAGDVYRVSTKSCEMLLNIVKKLTATSPKTKLFCITQKSIKVGNSGILSQAPLVGLARIIHAEEGEIFGGLIDVEDASFPMQAIKYVRGVDVVRIDDGVARSARLRPLAVKAVNTVKPQDTFHIRPNGTYVITGGLGALGLEVAMFLADKGARRLVLVSRRCLLPRREWASQKEDSTIQQILSLEAMGVSVISMSLDITSPSASSELLSALENLSLPPVLGVVHAAGTIANQLVMETTMDTFKSVTAPKIMGAMALDEAFPPKTLDFMVLFSSCGQILGFPGQASYASGNAFLDTLALQRRAQGDNTISILWTSWRGLGMAASTRYIDTELHARGITDVTSHDAFLALERIVASETDHAVVLRTLILEANDMLPHPILADVVRRRGAIATAPAEAEQASQPEPTNGPELRDFLIQNITQCVASTLSLSEKAIDPQTPLSELGMDSVMTVDLRMQLQRVIKSVVGPTLLWKCPNIEHLVQHFMEERRSDFGGSHK